MAVTHEIIAGVGDLRGIIFQCKCGGHAVIISSEGGSYILCQSCREHQSLSQPYLELRNVIDAIRAHEKGKNSQLKVLFEFEVSKLA